MDSKDHLEFSCNTSSIITPVELRKPTETMNEEIIEKTTVKCIIEEKLPSNDYMYPSEPLDPSKFVNYYDSKEYVFDIKKEYPENKCPQEDYSMNRNMVSHYTESLTLINTQIVKIENTEEELSLIIKKENGDDAYQYRIKTEMIEEQDILNNAGANSIHYDVLVTPQEIQCKLCFKIFRNSFDLLKHNQEHIRVKIITPRVNVMDEIHQCQFCVNRFDNYANMLIHVSLVHNKKTHKCELCGIQFKSPAYLKRHIIILHKYKFSPKQETRNSVKCIYCNEHFEHRYKLYKHIKLCRIGKEDEGIKIYKCDSCKSVYTSKRTLKLHIKRTHYDYGRLFNCSCGEQFRTPIHLSEHKKRQHGTKTKYKKDEVYKCIYCEAVFNEKTYLSKHIKRSHYNYGEMFNCSCGKKFRTPMNLVVHKKRQHSGNIKVTNNNKFQCEYCQRVFKNKYVLSRHVKYVHYDYDEVFECPCGKKFRTPIHLNDHKNRHCRQHVGNIKDTNNGKFQCDYCHKFFTSKHGIASHIQSIHYDYDKVFECWCGKQFRTPLRLAVHKRRQHRSKIKNTTNTNDEK